MTEVIKSIQDGIVGFVPAVAPVLSAVVGATVAFTGFRLGLRWLRSVG